MKPSHVLGAILMVSLTVAGCSERSLPTEPAEAPGPQSSTAAVQTWYASVGGPTTVTTNGPYTWHASTNVFEPFYKWYSRNCPTLSATSCTATWYLASTGSYSYTRNMARDCTGGGTKSLQLRVNVTGWYSANVTSGTHVVRLCPPVEP